jgi:hypothetical protein
VVDDSYAEEVKDVVGTAEFVNRTVPVGSAAVDSPVGCPLS